MPRRMKDKKGQYWIVNDDGTAVKLPNPSSSDLSSSSQDTNDPIFRTDPNKESVLRAPTMADKVFNYFGRYVPGGLSAIGGAVGEASPIPGGLIMGTAAGTTVGNVLKHQFPSIFGNPPESKGQMLGEMAVETGVNALTSGVGKVLSAGFPSVREQLKQQLLRRFFPPTLIDDSTKEALRADPNFPFTIGQTNQLAKVIENITAPGAKDAILKEQKESIFNQARPRIIDREKVLRAAQKKTKKNLADWRAERKALYDDFNLAINYPGNAKKVVREISGKPTNLVDAAGNPIISPPTYEEIDIQGAIPLDKSKQFADMLGTEIDKVLGPNDVNYKSLGEGLGASLKRLQGELDKIRSVQTHLDPVTHKPTNTYISFNQLKTIKDELSDFIKIQKPTSMRNKLQGGLETLRDLIDVDMNEGVKGWGTNSYSRFRKAQDFHKEMTEKIGTDMAARIEKEVTNPKISLKRLSAEAMNDPKRMEQFINATGTKTDAKKLVTSEIYKAAFDETSGKFNPTAGLNYLSSRRDIAKKAITSKALGEYERFLKRAQLVEPFSEGAYAKLKMANGALQMAIGIGSMLAGGLAGDIPSGVKFGAGTLLFGRATNEFSKRILMNPRYARIATGLLDADPKTRFAKMGEQVILNGLRGAQVIWRAPDGREFPAEVTEQGKVKFK